MTDYRRVKDLLEELGKAGFEAKLSAWVQEAKGRLTAVVAVDGLAMTEARAREILDGTVTIDEARSIAEAAERAEREERRLEPSAEWVPDR